MMRDHNNQFNKHLSLSVWTKVVNTFLHWSRKVTKTVGRLILLLSVGIGLKAALLNGSVTAAPLFGDRSSLF